MTNLYQLCCTGRHTCFSGTFRAYSKRVFRSKSAAEEYGSTFIDRCCGDGLSDCDKATAKVQVVELEFDD